MNLLPGTPVTIFAPAGAVKPEELKGGIGLLKKWGLKVEIPADLWDRERYLAGPTLKRAQRTRSYLEEGRVLWAARGGFGTLALLPHLEDLNWKKPPLVLGFSDLTILLLFLWDRYRQPSWHVPTVNFLPHLEPRAQAQLKALLKGKSPFRLKGRTLREGQAEGVLLGGNLTSLVSLLGTPYQPDLRGALLFLEEVNEKPYRLERLFTQLALAGIFSEIKALILGDLSGLSPSEYLSFLEELLPLDLPVGYSFPFGHLSTTQGLPVGVKGRFKAQKEGALLFQIDPEGN